VAWLVRDCFRELLADGLSIWVSLGERMSLFERFPIPVRRAAQAILPARLLVLARRTAMRRYNLEMVVVRETPARAWFNRHLLRLYYPPSLVTRESALRRWTSVHIKGELPALYHFDIHITDHCNLNCRGCGHFSNLCEPNFLDLDAFREDMAAMAAKLRIEQIYLLGGEPLLHPRIAEFIRDARSHFPTTRIYVVTNGSLVMRQNEEFWRAMAETRTILMCDAYPIGLPVEDINRKGEETGVAVEWTDARELFFKVPLDVTGSQDPADSYRRCGGINNCPMYKDGRLYPCAYTSYIEVFKERFGVDGLVVSEADSISVQNQSSQEIMEFMTKPVPFCCNCDFDRFEMYPWGRTERKLEEWT